MTNYRDEGIIQNAKKKMVGRTHPTVAKRRWCVETHPTRGKGIR
jgi:hypothetical protein